MTLPNFLVIGVSKAGTTSLYRYLQEHPDIFMSPVKEANFFAVPDFEAGRWATWQDPGRFQIRTLEQYQELFAGVDDEVAVGEASPVYFHAPTAHERIRQLIPDVRLVATLRNPVDRAYSGFMMRTRKGQTTVAPEEALTADSHHVRQGLYTEPLRRYFEAFPADHIKVIIFEEMAADPAGSISDLYGFLGVDRTFTPDLSQRHNVGGAPRSVWAARFLYQPAWVRQVRRVVPDRWKSLAGRIRRRNVKPSPPMPAELRGELAELYRPDIARLEELLGRNLDVWRP